VLGATPAQPAAKPVAPAPVAAAGRPVALLAPLTGPNAERGQALVNAAQLALATPGSPTLDVRDTGGTAEGAAAAATAAIAAGDGLILGPLTSVETAAVAPVARPAGVAVLAFTNDTAQAQPGVWTLGITPAQQVRRLVGASLTQGKSRFAAALPDSGFGHAMGTALGQALSAAGAGSANIHYYEPTNAGISATIRDLSDYASRRGPLEERRRAAVAAHSAEGRQAAADLSRAAIPPPPFDVLLLAETGERLAWLTTFLTYYDVEPPAVQLMGPALWAAPASRSGASVNGAWYAAPDPAARATFEEAFTAKYSSAPQGVADFGYDAAAIARVLAAEGAYSFGALCRPEGFAGVNGLLVLQPDGSVRRGLALFQVDRGGASRIEPAPETISAPGI
jgi:hypothetical protein